MVTIKTQVVNWYQQFREFIQPFLENNLIIKGHEPDLREKIEKAHREWMEAENYFNNVTEPGLVDHASYLVRAAESKYIYLLDEAKKNDFHLD